MRFEFTAIYKMRADGWVVAYVAEMPKVTTGGWGLDEARTGLVEKLRGELEFDRAEGLRVADPGARVECLCVETGPIPGRSAPNHAVPDKPDTASWTAAETKFFQTLLDQGLIDQLPDPLAFDSDDFEPVQIEGRPISEEIIEERR